MSSLNVLQSNLKQLSLTEQKTYTKMIFENLRSSLRKHLDFNLKVFGDWQVLNLTDFRITFKGKAHFLNVKMRGYKIKTKLEQGFLVDFEDLLALGANYEQLPFYNEIIKIKDQLSMYKAALTCHMNLSKIYVYVGLNEDTLHYLLTFDTGESLLSISDIPEMEHKSVEFMRSFNEGFYLFVHSNNQFKENLDKIFFSQYKLYRPDATNDDFLLDLMKAI